MGSAPLPITFAAGHRPRGAPSPPLGRPSGLQRYPMGTVAGASAPPPLVDVKWPPGLLDPGPHPRRLGRHRGAGGGGAGALHGSLSTLHSTRSLRHDARLVGTGHRTEELLVERRTYQLDGRRVEMVLIRLGYYGAMMRASVYDSLDEAKVRAWMAGLQA